MAENKNWFDSAWEWLFGAPGSVETIPSLDPNQQRISGQLGGQLSRKLGYGGVGGGQQATALKSGDVMRAFLQGGEAVKQLASNQLNPSNGLSQALGSGQSAFSSLEPIVENYLQSLLGQGVGGGGDYSGLRTPTPQSIRGYGTMGLRAIQTANQAILGREGQGISREGQRLSGAGLAQNLWREPYELALQYLGIPMMASYMNEPSSGVLGDLIGLGTATLGGRK